MLVTLSNMQLMDGRHPIDSSKVQKVKVHWDGEILSCSHLTGAERLCESHSEATAVEMEGKGENYSQCYSCLTSVIIVQEIVLP